MLTAAINHPNCQLCYQPLPVHSSQLSDGSVQVQCDTCSTYEITPEAFGLLLTAQDVEKRYPLSGRAKMAVIETGVRCRFDEAAVQAMKDRQLRDKTFGEAMLSVMRWLATQRPGRWVPLNQRTSYPAGYCANEKEFAFLLTELGKTTLARVEEAGRSLGRAQITGEGWRWFPPPTP